MKNRLALVGIILLLLGCANTQPQPLNLSISTPAGATVEKSTPEQINRSMSVENDQLQFKKCRICGDAVFLTITDIGGWGSSGDELWMDFQLIRNRGFKKLFMFLLSPGGAAYQGLAISDEIRLLKADGVYVEVHGRGLIASAAVPVFLAANKRIASRNTTFLMHPAALSKGGFFSEDLKDLQSQARMISLLNDQYISIVMENSKVTEDQAREMIERDTWITVTQAVEYGFVDEVR